MMSELGFYGGKIIDINTPIVPLEDRGHQFGDGVYEVVVTYGGKYFALQEHLERFEKSCGELRLIPLYSRLELVNICQLLLKESQLTDAMLYMQWTRGASPRTHAFPNNTEASFSATIRKKKRAARTTTPAPSERTKPLRSTLKGREASAGLS